MNFQKALYFLISLVLTGGIALAQQAAPAPPPPDVPPDAPPMALAPSDAPGMFSMFIEGGSFLGVYAEDISKENMGRYGLREARGVGITQVVKDSPADKAGLRKDDVIMRFEGESVTSVRKLTRLVSEVAPDQTARLSISRGGNEQEVSVTMGKRDQATNTFHRFPGFEGFEGLQGLQGLKGLQGPEGLRRLMPPGAPGANMWKWEGTGPDGQGMVFAFGGGRRIGVSTTQLTKQLADYFGIADGKGVLVTSVTDDSPAAKAGIKAGDVITAIDGEKVEGAGDLSRAINKKKDGEVTLIVIHNKTQRTVTVTPTEAKPPDQPGVPPGRRIVVPRIEVGSIPEMNIVIPQINFPVIPEINIQLPKKIKTPRVRVIKSPAQQPI